MCFKYHIAKRICRVFLKNWQFSQKKISIFVRFIIAFGVGSVSQKGLVKISNLQTYAHRYYIGYTRAYRE